MWLACIRFCRFVILFFLMRVQSRCYSYGAHEMGNGKEILSNSKWNVWWMNVNVMGRGISDQFSPWCRESKSKGFQKWTQYWFDAKRKTHICFQSNNVNNYERTEIPFIEIRKQKKTLSHLSPLAIIIYYSLCIDREFAFHEMEYE